MMMNSLIEVFRMDELKPKTRAKIIIKLGRAINDHHCMCITEPIVFELVAVLDPTHKILKDEHYLREANKT